jgi:hypothetical protein
MDHIGMHYQATLALPSIDDLHVWSRVWLQQKKVSNGCTTLLCTFHPVPVIVMLTMYLHITQDGCAVGVAACYHQAQGAYVA